jgi:hypothetical protein
MNVKSGSAEYPVTGNCSPNTDGQWFCENCQMFAKEFPYDCVITFHRVLWLCRGHGFEEGV